ncbi:hypothetical protein BC628DRAFT_1382069 [Trametes gibbosa]|nr:hypothetical protein BC628DRAFT_1382069 [Trametes gibbosa]
MLLINSRQLIARNRAKARSSPTGGSSSLSTSKLSTRRSEFSPAALWATLRSRGECVYPGISVSTFGLRSRLTLTVFALYPSQNIDGLTPRSNLWRGRACRHAVLVYEETVGRSGDPAARDHRLQSNPNIRVSQQRYRGWHRAESYSATVNAEEDLMLWYYGRE